MSVSHEHFAPSGPWGQCNFLWQIILAKELAFRLERHVDSSKSGFTGRIKASLIVADLWLQNVQIELNDSVPISEEMRRPKSEEKKARAEIFKLKGNTAMKDKRFRDAVESYTEAMNINPANPV